MCTVHAYIPNKFSFTLEKLTKAFDADEYNGRDDANDILRTAYALGKELILLDNLTLT